MAELASILPSVTAPAPHYPLQVSLGMWVFEQNVEWQIRSCTHMLKGSDQTTNSTEDLNTSALNSKQLRNLCTSRAGSISFSALRPVSLLQSLSRAHNRHTIQSSVSPAALDRIQVLKTHGVPANRSKIPMRCSSTRLLTASKQM